MKHNLSKATCNDVHKLIHLKLLMWIKRVKPAYCRGAPPGESGAKKENKISNFGTAVTFKSYCGLFAFKNRNNLSQRGRACKQID